MGVTLMVLQLGTALAAAPAIPTCTANRPTVEREPLVGTVRWTAWLALRGYQELISPADGRSCRFFPSCSTYALQAVRRHGALVGVVMGLERIQRNHGGWFYTPCRHQGAILLLDPVEANDWWFRRHPVGSGEFQERP